MAFRILALDYDGTIATDGRVEAGVLQEVSRLRAEGNVVLLVTGRILADLRSSLGSLRPFDAVVAEEGAVLAFPASGRSRLLAPPPDPGLLAELQRHGIAARRGQSLIECDAAHAPRALERIRTLELPLVLHFNRGRMMILPQAVSKATGLLEALRALRLSAHNAIAIGDAENDHELLRLCEVGVAVGWGTVALQRAADLVLAGEGPPAVARFLRERARSNEVLPGAARRRRLMLGRFDDGAQAHLEVRGRNVLIAGDPGSGKSWLAGLLSEELVLQAYSLCIVDPEGDYGELASLPGVTVVGGKDPLPQARELARLFSEPDSSVVLDLSCTPAGEKVAFVTWLLEFLLELRRSRGLPHRILIDEAHYFLDDPRWAPQLADALHGTTLVTYRLSALPAEILAASEALFVTRETDAREVGLLRDLCRGKESEAHWREILAGLELDEAALLPGPGEAGGRLRRFHLAPRLTHHVRHQHKYLDASLPEEHAFRFDPAIGPGRRRARSLSELVEVLECTDSARLDGHLSRSDFSRWVRDVFRDGPLAARLAELEELHRLGRLADVNGALVQALLARYRTPPSSPEVL